MTIIDPPSVFDTADEWRRFLAEMKELAREHPDEQDIKDAIAGAEKHLAELED
jgi:ferredoxin